MGVRYPMWGNYVLVLGSPPGGCALCMYKLMWPGPQEWLEQLHRSDSQECSTAKMLEIPLDREATGLLEHFAQGRSALACCCESLPGCRI